MVYSSSKFAFPPLASVSAQSYFEDGQEVVFETQVAASAGSMDYATHTSGFTYKMRTRAQFSSRQINIKVRYLLQIFKMRNAFTFGKFSLGSSFKFVQLGGAFKFKREEKLNIFF